MGKVKTIDPEKEALKAKEKAQKEAERLAKVEAAKTISNAKKPSEAKAIDDKKAETVAQSVGEIKAEAQGQKEESKKKTSKYAAKHKGKGRERSEKYEAALTLVDKAKLYSTKEALALLEKIHLASFDETVELHINTNSSGLSGQVTLPHGTGKKIRIAILQPAKDAKGSEELLKEIESGKISFDILIATPDAMPKLARVAKVLGPRGLMPNPKAGTVTANPEAVAAQYAGGQMYFKTESKTPVIHAAVGRLSFGPEKLSENIAAFLKAVKMENIKKVVIKSTMSPAIKLQLNK